ncbi:MAG: AAC(3) family N-acetyltransferase, partial [Phycisphaerae bacterium]
MENYKSGSHTRHDLKANVAWITKYRKPVLGGDIAKRVRKPKRRVKGWDSNDLMSTQQKKLTDKIRTLNFTISRRGACASYGESNPAKEVVGSSLNVLVNNQHKMVHDLRRLGIQEGDRIFVHSSFKRIGLSDGGPAAVVAALQKAVGAKGTLGMPVFPFCFSPDVAFDPATSPSKVGAITEVFRQTKGVVRSYSPSHSVAFWGQDAEYLASSHADISAYA